MQEEEHFDCLNILTLAGNLLKQQVTLQGNILSPSCFFQMHNVSGVYVKVGIVIYCKALE